MRTEDLPRPVPAGRRHPPRPTGARARVAAVLLDHRYAAQAQPRGAVDELRRQGWEVRTVVADRSSHDLRRPGWLTGVDVVLARGRSDALLGLLRASEVLGVPVVTTAAAVSGVVDKASMATALALHGIPTPRTWLGRPAELALREDLVLPVVLKPVTGDNARGLVVVRSRRDLARVRWPEPVALAQTFHRGDGHDLKLYVVGERVWAVRRPSPVADDGSPRPSSAPGEETEVSPELVTVARRCARVFGLPLLGVDVVGGPDHAYVVEVNDYPTYRGVLGEADACIARLVGRRARPAPRGVSSAYGVGRPVLGGAATA